EEPGLYYMDSATDFYLTVVRDDAVAAGSTAAVKEILQNKDLKDATTDEDRKSTRLNSSHSQISYAVFCLKKKKKKKKIKNTKKKNTEKKTKIKIRTKKKHV